ncbi:MAG: hypothetical protein ACTSRK_06760 [Promethearchaeota archaeon]
MSLPNKDNLTNATSTSQIDWYFDLDNPEAIKRHWLFFGLGTINAVIILIVLILNVDGYGLILWIGIMLALILIATYMVLRKYSYYRFIIYLFGFGGILSCLFYVGTYLVVLIPIIISGIFLINFASIELSLQRHLNWFVRGNKMRNFRRFGSDNFEEK